MTAYIYDFIIEEDGPTALEYAVLIALIIIVCMSAISFFGNQVSAWFTGASPTITSLPTA